MSLEFMAKGIEHNQISEHKELAHLLKKANLPTLSEVAQRLVGLCKDDDADFAAFARVIESDPGLSSRILRVANSAYYGLRHKATTLDRAISALGLKYVKSVALGFHLASSISQFEADGFDMKSFWSQSLFRAVMARQIAKTYCPDRREEAFLVGLLQDCGIPFLAQALGKDYAELWRESKQSQTSLYMMERELFSVNHLVVAEALMKRWGLPELLASPIQTHHRRSLSCPSMAEEVQLCQVGYFVGSLPLNDPESLSKEDMTLHEYANSTFGLSIGGLNQLLEDTRDEYGMVSQLFGQVLGDQEDVTKLLKQANSLLSSLADDANKKIFDFELEVKRFKSQCESLNDKLDYYKHQAETDNLTGLATRNVLNEFLENACDSLRTIDATLMTLLIDIDRFREINMSHGRRCGDLLLQEFSRMLKGLFKEAGCVARYGSNEFVVSLMGPQLKQSIQLAQALLDRIRGLQFTPDPKKSGLSISCSIGMVFYDAKACPGCPASILELADHQLYQVKQSGKNNMQYMIRTAEGDSSTGNEMDVKQITEFEMEGS